MPNSNSFVPCWDNLFQDIKKYAHEDPELLKINLNLYLEKVANLLKFKPRESLLKKIAYDSLKCLYFNKIYCFFELNMNELRSFYKNSNLHIIKFCQYDDEYDVNIDQCVDFEICHLLAYEDGMFAWALWFIKEFKNSITAVPIYTTLVSHENNDRIQECLVDLLGYDKLDLVSELLCNRVKICKDFLELYDIRKRYLEYEQLCKSPTPIQAIFVSNDIRMKAEKKFMKQNKKLYATFKRDYAQFDWKFLDQFFKDVNISKVQPKSSQTTFSCNFIQTQQYPFVFDSKSVQNSVFDLNGQKLNLPQQTIINKDMMFDEVVIPFRKNVIDVKTFNKIKISNLDDFIQKIFDNIQELNLIQSIVYDRAINSAENLLICAPTGAGKTNISLLTIIRELKKCLIEKTLALSDIRIVYVVPMKALATEITYKFHKSLHFLGIHVREVTGDTQLTKTEILSCNILVTTPEKWDVLTRKSDGETSFTLMIRLLIIDEIHLLQDDRGAVIESIVARALRYVESHQISLRIIGLSATLPNYLDVAAFLNVNPYTGLFYFDGSFRPVPLEQRFIGIKPSVSNYETFRKMDEIAFNYVQQYIHGNNQVIVFLHSRDSTRKNALHFLKYLESTNHIAALKLNESNFVRKTKSLKFHTKVLEELIGSRISIHHAGLPKHDRNLVEKYFLDGTIRVLFSTSTLAWGVNLPAHAVIVKGTSLYDSNTGRFKNLGILDIMQMFGRAGRPQYDKTGVGILITEHKQLNEFVSLVLHHNPIESKLLEDLPDCLNAEITLGTVTNVSEAIKWLSYTFLYVRMLKNPLVYGLTNAVIEKDPTLHKTRELFICRCSQLLDKSKMIRYNPQTQILSPTALGRIGAYYYIKCKSINGFNERIKPNMSDREIFQLISLSSEFEHLKVRDEEIEELKTINQQALYSLDLSNFNTSSKVFLLLQSFLSKISLFTPSLLSDAMYISQNIGRIVRGYYQICVFQSLPVLCYKLLTLAKAFDQSIWPHAHPLTQFKHSSQLNSTTFEKISRLNFSLDQLFDMSSQEIDSILRTSSCGHIIKKMIKSFPSINITATAKPLTRSVLHITISIKPNFDFDPSLMTIGSDSWALWIEDTDSHQIYHHTQVSIAYKKCKENKDIIENVVIPIWEPIPSQYIIRLVSEKFIGAESEYILNTHNLVLPEEYTSYTKLLPLTPLNISILKNKNFEKIYNFSYFNPIQTQMFHSLYHTDVNILLGAPTGSGKTIVSELSILRLFRTKPLHKIVYIAPIKSLVKQRYDDWIDRFGKILNKKIVELTGDFTPDIDTLKSAHIILTTPEKWDGISRLWRERSYVLGVSLVIIDEVHLLGADRGHILEAIISRVKVIHNETGMRIRIVALSTASSNALDVADWLEVPLNGLFNFHPSVRPVPLVTHIHGFPSKHYCPRMESMNKTVFLAIQNYSAEKPVLIFTSSRRQTRRTASALLAYSSTRETLNNWCHMNSSEIEYALKQVSDDHLKTFIPYGMGIHHAGLKETDRKVVENLFLTEKIQILIATSTLAWGVNFPAHLVIIKGTEYYDGETKTYVDFPVTDVLQMMGRAGRPQFDNSGTAVVLVHEPKKYFFKKFLYEPFPIESSLLDNLADHFNAEIAANTIKTIDDAHNYLTLSFLARRIVKNPTFYRIDSTLSKNKIINALKHHVFQTLGALVDAKCVKIHEDGKLESTVLGTISSFYYLNFKTIKIFDLSLNSTYTIPELIVLISNATEFDKIPVRHNEDQYNSELSSHLPLLSSHNDFSSPHIKTFLLLQAHIARQKMPIHDYYTDLKSVIDQTVRIIQGMIDVSAYKTFLKTTISLILFLQSIQRRSWWNMSPLLSLDNINPNNLDTFISVISSVIGENLILPSQLAYADVLIFEEPLTSFMSMEEAKETITYINNLPLISLSWTLLTQEEVVIARDTDVVDDDHECNYINCPFDTDLKLVIRLRNDKHLKKQKNNKNQGESTIRDKNDWFVIVGHKENDEVITLKRLSVNRLNTKTTLFVGKYSEEDVGSRQLLTIYFISQNHMGLDQQYEVPLNVV